MKSTTEKQEVSSQDRLAHLLALAISLEPVLFDKVLDIATTDELTGAYQQSFLKDGLANELNRAKVLRYPLSLLSLALEARSEVSEDLRPLVYEQALRMAADELKQLSRTTDWVVRSDDSELFLVLPGCPTGRLKELGRQLAERLSPLEVRLADGTSHQVEAILGGACHFNGSIEVDQLVELTRDARSE
ncbi:MAG: diguanylate cyclase domain-containing protein, partial [Anaerolineales bacterium]